MASSALATCSAEYNCPDCTGEAGCGWSISRNQCKNGDSDGSTDGTSSGSDWAYFSSECSGGGGGGGGSCCCCPLFLGLPALAIGGIWLNRRNKN